MRSPFDAQPQTPEEWQAAVDASGPHAERYIQVYANPVASAAFQRADHGTLPVGSILATEKRTGSDAVTIGVAFMIKRPDPAFAASGGWEFLYYPSEDPSSGHERCLACHEGASQSDYVFGHYPQ